MIIYKGSTGTYTTGIDLSQRQEGSLGAVYTVLEKPELAAKIYRESAPSRRGDQSMKSRIEYMVDHKPDASVLDQIAWPTEVLTDYQERFAGYTMPKLNASMMLSRLYNYPSDVGDRVTVEKRLQIAVNLCTVVAALHAVDYVIGDFNPLNIGFDPISGRVALYDADSYHFFTKDGGRVHRCELGTDGYLAPEILDACREQSLSEISAHLISKESDDFALAVHLFRILMNGCWPFQGMVVTNPQATRKPKSENAYAERNNYWFAGKNKEGRPAQMPDISLFPEEIGELFHRTFVDGANDPAKRASASEWAQALSHFKSALQQCTKNNSHYFAEGGKCPYCKADRQYRKALEGDLPIQGKAITRDPGGITPPKPHVVTTKAKKPLALRIIKWVLMIPLWILFFPIVSIYTICKVKKFGNGIKALLIFLDIMIVIPLWLTSCVYGVAYGVQIMEERAAAKDQIVIDVDSMVKPFIKGYDHYGYFDDSLTQKGTYVWQKDDGTRQRYNYELTFSDIQNGAASFKLSVDKGGEPLGDAVISAACNTLLSNSDMLQFSVTTKIKDCEIVLQSNNFRISSLKTDAFERSDPRDYFMLTPSPASTLLHPLYQIAVSDEAYTVGDRSIRLSVIEDPRPGAAYVQPGLHFEVYDGEENLLGAGDYIFASSVAAYDADADAYYSASYFGSYLMATFDQAELLSQTGILFSTEERSYSLK